MQDHPRSRGVYVLRKAALKSESGSSPLARGLPTGHLPWVRAVRIIPARAGFTAHASSSHSHPGDHPRSRGVYSVTWPTSARPLGSSPLARGLRFGKPRETVANRIIPARAGFTTRSPMRCSGARDHPRSRGVYTAFMGGDGYGFGSSPLARGLPWATPGAISTHADHPRSRGVYPLWCLRHETSSGSSPLARGLLCAMDGHGIVTRIIPARAGFTACPRGSRPAFRDHPRSRGVYPAGSGGGPVIVGSSPLARGLRYSESYGVGPARIIPARAGFTSYTRPGPICVRDHPRSRGVYPTSAAASYLARGSSPLARGLQQFWQLTRAGGGIIPARAGFTRVSGLSLNSRPDHPRSRGVYEQWLDVEPGAGGSSPLARGLPRGAQAGGGGGRIIPARAGFTRWWGRGRGPRPDHPRSRGVYVLMLERVDVVAGSSPLARGLLVTTGFRGLSPGIIPARAGFTVTGPAVRSGSTDHPRSRGVYHDRDESREVPTGSSPLARGLHRGSVGCRSAAGIIPARAGFTP